MDQIFMLEFLIKQIILKIDPPEKDAYELAQEAEEKRLAEEAAALALLNQKKKKKPKKARKPKKKKGKKGPAGPSEEEMKFLKTCACNVNCTTLFDFNIAHDNFVAPPPPPVVKKKKKKKPKPKPKPKGKKKKKKKIPPFKIPLPSEPLPQPPFFGVGNVVVFVSSPDQVIEHMKNTPIHIRIWNKNPLFECTGFVFIKWDKSFIECLEKAANVNPTDLKKGQFRDTTSTHMITNTVELSRPLQCEDCLVPAGLIECYIKLTCLGNRIATHFVKFPEILEKRLLGRKWLWDDEKYKDLEILRHWNGTDIETLLPVPYFYSAPDIIREPIRPEEPPVVFEEFVAPFTKSELCILSMGFPKGPCGGTNCPKRLDYRGSQHKFIFGEFTKGKFHHGSFVNKRDVHGPCGRLDCPLAKKVRQYLCNEGVYKQCRKPCPKEYY